MKLALLSIFVEPKTPPLGLGSIATYIEKYSGFKNTVIIDMNYDNIMERIKEEKPDLIGMGPMTIYYPKSIELAKEIKKISNAKILLGGYHISTCPESLRSCFDIGIIGEGEETMLELVKLFEEKGEFKNEDLKNVKGITYWENGNLVKSIPRDQIRPLDDVPIVNRDFFNPSYFRKMRMFGTGTYKRWFSLMSARGCPYRCKFCSPTIIWGGSKVRYHSIERVVEEIGIGIAKYGAEYVYIGDDLVAVSKKRMRALQIGLKEAGHLDKIQIGMNIRSNLVDDEMCQILKDLNVVSIGIGFESGNDEMLKYLKGPTASLANHKRAIDMFTKYGIPVFGSFIFGNPGESLDQMRDTLALIKYAYKKKVGFVYPFILKPYPGTDIWDVAKARGVVSEDMRWETLGTFVEEMNETNFPYMLDKDIDIKDFNKIFKKAVWYAKLISLRHLRENFIRNPVLTLKEIGNPITFVINRYKLMKKDTIGTLTKSLET